MKKTPFHNSPRPRTREYADDYPERRWQWRAAFWLLLAIAAFYLFTEHRVHLALGLPYLPILLLAACPLLHLFGHGHSGHHGHRHSPQRRLDDAYPPPGDVRPSATGHPADGAHQREEDRS